MNLKIIGPTTHKTLAISWIEVETLDGNFVVQRGHAPMILALLPDQPVTVSLKNGRVEVFNNFAGILEIQRDAALLFLYK